MNRHMLRLLLGLLTVLALSISVAACGDDDEDEGSGGAVATQPSDTSAQKPAQGPAIQPIPGASSTSITVGSKDFTEQFILGEIYGQALEAAGYRVKTDLNLGDALIANKALKAGEIDAYPEYTGTALTAFFDVKVEDVPKGAAQAYADAKAGYADDDITAYAPTPFENTYRLGVTKATAEKLGNPTKISDLSGKESDLSITGFPECRQRIDCLLGVQQTYDLKFGKFVPSTKTYDVMKNNDADVAFVFTTDGPLNSGNYVVLEDDKSLFPPYNITLTVRNEIARKLGPEGQKVIESVQKNMTEKVMQELNARVDIDKQKPEQAAEAYLKQFGYVR